MAKTAYDELMRKLGVKPLEGRLEGRDERAVRPARLQKAESPARKQPAPPAADNRLRKAAAALGRESAAAPEEAAALRNEAAAARADARAAAEAAGSLEAEIAALRAEKAEWASHRRSLHEALRKAQVAVPESGPDLAALLARRGLVGPDEAGFALGALVAARAAHDLVALLVPSDSDAAASFLDERMALTCGQPACAPPPGRAVVTVPAERCDTCAGSDILRAVGRFVDVCLVHGTVRVCIVGGSPRYHRQLRDLVDKRIHLRLVPGDRKRTAAAARTDEAASDLVVVWGGTILDHAVSNLYGHGSTRTIRVSQRGIARMLEVVADAIAAVP